MSKNYTAITKKGRGMQNPTASCSPTLSAPKSRWGQKWVNGRLKSIGGRGARGGPSGFPSNFNSSSTRERTSPQTGAFSCGAGCEIRTRDLMITNCNRHKNPGISKAFRPFSLQNQQLVPAIPSTVSTPKFRPVGQLVGPAHFPCGKWAGRFG